LNIIQLFCGKIFSGHQLTIKHQSTIFVVVIRSVRRTNLQLIIRGICPAITLKMSMSREHSTNKSQQFPILSGRPV